MAIVQLRNPNSEGRAYYDHRKAGGKNSMEALRSLKRRLSDLVYKTMLNDAVGATGAGPGGQPGDVSDSSAADSQPHIDSSEQPLHEPAETQPTTPLRAAS